MKMRCIAARCCGMLLALWPAVAAAQAPATSPATSPAAVELDSIRVYHVGNSVTDTISYDALGRMAARNGKGYVFGRHVIPGAPLEWIWNHPADGFTQPPYGYYPQALAEFEWDAVTLQPFDRLLESDADYAGRYIAVAEKNPANADIRWLIYSRWPRRAEDGSLDFAQAWQRSYTGGWDNTNETRDYFEKLLLRLRADHPGHRIDMVPVGDVLFALNQRMRDGGISGLRDVTELYSDGIHFNNLGRFVVACTFYATMYGRTPVGLDPEPYGGSVVIGPERAEAVCQVIWQVVSQHPYAGLAR